MATTEATPLLTAFQEKQTPKNCNGTTDVKLTLDFKNTTKNNNYDKQEFSSRLSLFELLPYADDPWWQKLRRMLFYAFWLTILLAFLIACSDAYKQSGTCPLLRAHIEGTTLSSTAKLAP